MAFPALRLDLAVAAAGGLIFPLPDDELPEDDLPGETIPEEGDPENAFQDENTVE